MDSSTLKGGEKMTKFTAEIEVAKKHRKSKRSNSWSARGVGIMVRCPVPGCEHTGNIITKAHCRLVHNMERDEVKKKYGMPYNVKVGVI